MWFYESILLATGTTRQTTVLVDICLLPSSACIAFALESVLNNPRKLALLSPSRHLHPDWPCPVRVFSTDLFSKDRTHIPESLIYGEEYFHPRCYLLGLPSFEDANRLHGGSISPILPTGVFSLLRRQLCNYFGRWIIQKSSPSRQVEGYGGPWSQLISLLSYTAMWGINWTCDWNLCDSNA